MADQRDEILKFIKANGPVLPVQIAKILNTNILFASAMLSELVDRKLVKITHASIGGSPLYFLPDQEHLMDIRLSTSLGGKEREAYNLIKEKKVVREVELEPWQRVAIKSLTDFTKPLNVSVNNTTEVFWKHSLVTDTEAQELINSIMNSLQIQEVEEILLPQQIQQQIVNEKPKIQEKLQPKVKQETQLEDLEEEIFQPSILSNNIKNIRENFAEKPKKLKPLKEKKIIDKPSEFYNEIVTYLNKNNIKIIKEEIVKYDKEYEFIVDLPSSLGELRYFIKAKSKSIVNEADISMAFSDAKVKNLPAILLVDGKANKKALALIDAKFKGQLVLKEI